jgi:phospho-N-acetylmuramoyl-pentapeptide-transferase
MLYYIFYLLKDKFSGLGVIQYLTFRSVLAFFLSLIIVLIFQPIFIRWFKTRALGQPIREDGPQTHLKKQGTPTMGGVVFVLAVILSTVLLADLKNIYIWVAIGVTISYGALGFLDDYRKIKLKNSKGVSAREKLLWQFGTALVAVLILVFCAKGFSTSITVPFIKQGSFDLGWLFIPFAMLVIVSASNAVNLTDGLDGLVTGPVITVSLAYGIFAYVSGNAKVAEYLLIPHLPGTGELTIFTAAMIAAGLGFLWYNSFPAQVFMGDVGALAIGGGLGAVAVMTKQELMFIVAGGVFVVEALSVIIQVGYFKLTRKRIFRMAPIHHHFELGGLSEPKIIVRCWIISIILAVISLSTLKLR